MKNKKLTTYILIGVLVLIVIYWTYRFFDNRKPTPVGVTVTAGRSLDQVPGGDEFSSAKQLIEVLKSVNNITLAERSLLSNRIFQTKLQDFGRPLVDRPWGRNNPFAAPGVGGGPAPLTDQFDQVSTPTVPADDLESE